MSDQNETNDFTVLDDILFRFASTSDEEFEKPLNRVLPKVLGMLSRQSQMIRDKTLEILSHINKRLRANPKLSLPVESIIALFVSSPPPSSISSSSSSTSPPTSTDNLDPNLMTQCCLIYIERGFHHLPVKERVLLAPALLKGIGRRPRSQQRILLHIFLSVLSLPRHVEDALNALPPPPKNNIGNEEKEKKELRSLPVDDEDDIKSSSPPSDSPEAKAALAAAESKAKEKATRDVEALARFSWCDDVEDRNCVLSFLMDVCLFSPNMLVPWAAKQAIEAKEKGTTMPGPGYSLTGVSGKKEGKDEPKVMVIPAGMSQEGLDRITDDGKKTWQLTDLANAQSGVLSFVTSTCSASSRPLFQDNDLLLIGLAGACAADTNVGRRGEDVLRRLHSLKMEEPAIITSLMNTFMGQADQKQVDEKSRRSAASEALKIRILGHLSRSLAAANLGALGVKLVFDTLFSASTTKRLQLQGLSFLTWILQKCSTPNMMTTLAPVYLKGLLTLMTQVKAGAALAAAKRPSPPPNNFPDRIESSSSSASSQSSAIDFTGSLTAVSGLQVAAENHNALIRGRVYSLLGQLSLRAPALFNGNTKMMNLFFQALTNENDSQVQQNIHEGLSLLRQAYNGIGGGLALEVQNMLLELVNNDERRVRLCSLQCMNRLFPFHDVRARYMCLSLLNDPSPEVRDEAKRGLQAHVHLFTEDKRMLPQPTSEPKTPSSSSSTPNRNDTASPSAMDESNDESKGESKTESSDDTPSVASRPKPQGGTVLPTQAYPPFPEFMLYAYDQSTKHEIVDPGQRARRLQAIVEFGQHCYLHSAKSASMTVSDYTAHLVSTQDTNTLALDQYRTLIEQGFDFGISEVQSSCARALVKLVRYRPVLYAKIYAARLPWMKKFLQGGVMDTRRYMARLLQTVGDQLDEGTIMTLLSELTLTLEASWSRSTKTSSAPSKMSASTAVALAATGGNVIADSDGVHGALLGTGVLVAELVRRISSSSSSSPNSSVMELGRRGTSVLVHYLEPSILALDPDLTAAACKSLARIGLIAPLPLPSTTSTSLSSSSSSSSLSSSPSNDTIETPATKKSRVEEESSTSSSSTSSSSSSSSSSPSTKIGSTPSQFETISRLLAITKGQGRKSGRVVEEAVRALGNMSVGDRNPIILDAIMKGLFEMANIKLPEIHFTVGAAIAAVAVGNFYKVGADPLRDEKDEKQKVVAPQTWKDVTVSGESKTLLEVILDTIIYQFLSKGSLLTRASGSTWLLCLVKYCGSHPTIQTMLPLIQAAFSLVLTEADQFTQECASKGLAYSYQVSSKQMKEELMDGLVKTFTQGRREVNATTQILVNAERGEFSTYKELCGVANEMGQPDLIYKFLDLASHHSIWQSRLGAAFSLGSIVETKGALSPHIAGLIPKLYRYQFDPNPKIKSTMRQMWEAMVPEPRETVDKHFAQIMTELLAAQGGRQFRERQAACLALIDLLQSRHYNQVGAFLEPLWEGLFRVLDDVNEPVRKVASQLAKSMTNLCLRLCDPKYTTVDGVKGALDKVLPILLNKGIVERVTEVRSVSVNVLLKVTAVAGIHLRPHLPGVLRALLEGQSSLEPSAFSYLQFHTAAYNITPEQLEELRLQMLKSSPLADAVDSCQQLIDESSISGVVEVLVELMRTGVGLPTLSSCARMVVNLATGPCRHHLTPHTSALCRVLLSGLMDQSPSIRKGYANALGYTCRVSKRKRVGKTITDLLTLYTSPHLASEAGTDKGRLISGIALRAVVRRANEHAKEFASDIAPVAFVGMNDEDKEIAGVWTEVWDDLTAGREAGAVLYLNEIVTLAISVFTSTTSSYVLKVCAMKSIAEAATLTGLLFAPHLPSVIPLILKSFPGRLWNGKEILLTIVVDILKACKLRVNERDVNEVARALITELKREKRVYRRKAVEAVTALVNQFPSLLDVFALTREALAPIFETVAKGNKGGDVLTTGNTGETKDGAPQRSVLHSSAVATAGMEDDDNRVDGVLAAQAYECIGSVWPPQPSSISTPQASGTSSLSSLSSPSSSSSSSSSSEPITPGVTNKPASYFTWYDTQREHIDWLVGVLLAGLGAGLTWNVRVAILKAIKKICDTSYLQIPASKGSVISPWSEEAKAGAITSTQIDRLLPALAISIADGKFAAVRAAALDALVSLLQRPSSHPLLIRWFPLIVPHLSVLSRDRDSHVLRHVTTAQTLIDKITDSGNYVIPSSTPTGFEVGLTSLPALAASLALANAEAAKKAAAAAKQAASQSTSSTNPPSNPSSPPPPPSGPEAEDLYD